MSKQKGVVDPITIGFILVALIAVLGSGCATTQTDISRANAYCAQNGGVTQLKAKYSNAVHVTCGNTATFKFSSNGATK